MQQLKISFFSTSNPKKKHFCFGKIFEKFKRSHYVRILLFIIYYCLLEILKEIVQMSQKIVQMSQNNSSNENKNSSNEPKKIVQISKKLFKRAKK